MLSVDEQGISYLGPCKSHQGSADQWQVQYNQDNQWQVQFPAEQL
jgi:hypothetical protein